MISEESSPPDLEPRFLPPQGWRWHELTNARGEILRFGTVRPAGRARGVVVALPGLGEYCEKYFEVARDMLERGLAFCVLDWCGQGLSSRLLSNRQKRHSTGFSNDVEDLHAVICNPLSGVDPFAAGRLPAIMLAHSMGGNIGLRYLAAHGGIFDAAALCAPMVRIAALRGLPGGFSRRVSGFFARLKGESYVFGAGDWRPLHRPPPPLSVLSADPVRCRVHNVWCLHDPRLQVGGVTFGWLDEANRSCGVLEAPDVLESISIPCLVAVAGRDVLVDPRAARRAARRLARGRLLELPGCLHEILMERDVYRGALLEKFDALLKETLKDCTVRDVKDPFSGDPPMTHDAHDKARLSDRIFNALELSLTQKDVAVSELLVRALELSMTRSAGGAEFVERRDYPAEIEKAMKILDGLKKTR